MSTPDLTRKYVHHVDLDPLNNDPDNLEIRDIDADRLTENRLTDSDRSTITARLAEVIQGYSVLSQVSPTGSDAPTLERVAAHAIGCSADDLRDSEMSEIRAIVLTSLGLEDEPVTSGMPSAPESDAATAFFHAKTVNPCYCSACVRNRSLLGER